MNLECEKTTHGLIISWKLDQQEGRQSCHQWKHHRSFLHSSIQRCFLLRNQGMFIFGDGVKTSYVYIYILPYVGEIRSINQLWLRVFHADPCGSNGPILLTHPLGVTQKQERAQGSGDSNFWRFGNKRIWVRFHEIPLFSCKTWWRLEQWIWEIAWSSGETCWIPLEKVTGNGRGMGKDRPRSLPFRSSTMRFRPWVVDPKWWQALLPGGLKTSILLQKTTGETASRISAYHGLASVACQCNMVVPTFTVKSQILKCSTTPLLLRHLYCIQKTGK